MKQFVEVLHLDGITKSILNVHHIVEIREEKDHLTVITNNSTLAIPMSLDTFKQHAQITTDWDQRKIGF